MFFIQNDDPTTVSGPAGLRSAFPNTSNPELLDAAELAEQGFRQVTVVQPSLGPGQSYGPPTLSGDTLTYPVIQGQRYTKVSVARQRLQANDPPLWNAAVDAIVEAGGNALLAEVLSLEQGLAYDDERVRAILVAIGADPEVILA